MSTVSGGGRSAALPRTRIEAMVCDRHDDDLIGDDAPKHVAVRAMADRPSTWSS